MVIDIAGRMLELNAEQEAEINRLRAENEKLRAALKPLVKEYEEACVANGWTKVIVKNDPLIRAAAAALKETGDDK